MKSLIKWVLDFLSTVVAQIVLGAGIVGWLVSLLFFDCSCQKHISPPVDIMTFTAISGFLGDGEQGKITVSRINLNDNKVGSLEYKIEYHVGLDKWAGLRWQYPPNNWGDSAGVSIKGAHRISFYARGDRGDETVRFQSGGTAGRKYGDTYDVQLGEIPLTIGWKQYTIDLSNQIMSNVISPFAVYLFPVPGRDSVAIYIAKITIE